MSGTPLLVVMAEYIAKGDNRFRSLLGLSANIIFNKLHFRFILHVQVPAIIALSPDSGISGRLVHYPHVPYTHINIQNYIMYLHEQNTCYCISIL